VPNGPGYIVENIPNGGGCETSFNTKLGSPLVIGNVATLKFGQSASSNHPGWTATVILKCSPGSLPLTPTVQEVDVSGSDVRKLTFTFKLQTSAMCSGGGGSGTTSDSSDSGGCGGGCIFLILYFLGIGGYVAGGVAWNHFKEGKTGSDLVPNKDFWLDFPQLLKDGLLFLVHKVKTLFGRGDAASGGSYQTV
jgi:hypothetical protein